MPSIELNEKTLVAMVEYVNAKNIIHNEANKANFPVISVDDILEPKIRDSYIVCLIDGGIKGLQKHIIPYVDLNFRRLGRPKKNE